MILYIDTLHAKKITVALKKDGKVLIKKSEENEYGSQVLLPLIMKLLRITNLPAGRQGSKLKTLQAIEVETGPGSFTGIKVGVSVANALAFSLGIPVNGKKIETELKY